MLSASIYAKYLADEAGWLRETNIRKMQGAAQIFVHILEVLDSYVDEKAKSCADPRPFVVVMPAGEMDLSDFLSHQRVAGTNLQAVIDIARQVGQRVQYMHKCGWIHGDLKPKNIERGLDIFSWFIFS